MLNLKYAKFINENEIKYANDYLIYDGNLILNPKEDDYLKLNYKIVIDNKPEDEEGYYFIPLKWKLESDTIIREYQKKEIEKEIRIFTPLSIKRACGENWKNIKEDLINNDLYETFIMAQELIENDEDFVNGYNWAVLKYGKETVDDILNKAYQEYL